MLENLRIPPYKALVVEGIYALMDIKLIMLYNGACSFSSDITWKMTFHLCVSFRNNVSENFLTSLQFQMLKTIYNKQHVAVYRKFNRLSDFSIFM